MVDDASADPLTPPPDAARSVVPGSEAFIWQPCPGVVVQQARGVLSLPMAHCFAEFYRPILEPGAQLRVFDDFAAVTDYTREAREMLTELTLQHLDAIDDLNFLISSKSLALGVSAFKHQVGDERVHVYVDRDSFLRTYRAAVEERANRTE